MAAVAGMAHRRGSNPVTVLPGDTLLVVLVAVFVLAYLAIALEHPIRINKSASALLAAGLLWTVYAVAIGDPVRGGHVLDETGAARKPVLRWRPSAPQGQAAE